MNRKIIRAKFVVTDDKRQAVSEALGLDRLPTETETRDFILKCFNDRCAEIIGT